MEPWDRYIFTQEAAEDFLDEISSLDDDDIVDAVADACKLLVTDPAASDDDTVQGQVAATIAAIWAGAPYTVGDIVEDYPFIRRLIGQTSEEVSADACEILEAVDTGHDVDSYVETLASAD